MFIKLWVCVFQGMMKTITSVIRKICKKTPEVRRKEKKYFVNRIMSYGSYGSTEPQMNKVVVNKQITRDDRHTSMRLQQFFTKHPIAGIVIRSLILLR